MKTRILLLVLLISIPCSMVSAELLETTCICKCGEKDMGSTGFSQKDLFGAVSGSHDYIRTMEDCQMECAATCGSLADCSGRDALHPNADTCTVCCEAYCGGYSWVYPDPGIIDGDYEWHHSPLNPDYYKGACTKSCMKSCKLKETIGGIMEIVYYTVGIVAAIMFIISAYRIITSSTPEDRRGAKNGIMCVVIALMVIAIANLVVNLFIGGLNSEPTPPTFEPSTEEIGGIILDETVQHAYVGNDEITIHATVMNNGNKLGKHYVLTVYGKGDTEALAWEPDLLGVTLGPGQKKTLIISSDWSVISPWNVYDLKGGYYLTLGDGHVESMDKYDRYPDTGYEPV